MFMQPTERGTFIFDWENGKSIELTDTEHNELSNYFGWLHKLGE